MRKTKLVTACTNEIVCQPEVSSCDAEEIFIGENTEKEDVSRSPRPETWDDFFLLLKETDVPEDFLCPAERHPVIETGSDSFDEQDKTDWI